jgi:hypothetical protein
MGEHFDTLEFLFDRVKPDDPNNNYNSGQTLEPDGKTTAHTAVAMPEVVNTQTDPNTSFALLMEALLI